MQEYIWFRDFTQLGLVKRADETKPGIKNNSESGRRHHGAKTFMDS